MKVQVLCVDSRFKNKPGRLRAGLGLRVGGTVTDSERAAAAGPRPRRSVSLGQTSCSVHVPDEPQLSGHLRGFHALDRLLGVFGRWKLRLS